MTKDLSAMDELRSKQQELMAAVPHPLRRDSMMRMIAAKGLIEELLLYLNSTGHKPWRPNPLPREKQLDPLLGVIRKFNDLCKLHLKHKKPSKDIIDTVGARVLVSTFGGIEEIVEFYDSWMDIAVPAVNGTLTGKGAASARQHMLEELTDELFFFLERMILSDFSWTEVVEEYHRKWQVNMKRYADAKKGNYDWDDRGKKESL
ncbi:hypothetical protein MUP59_07030 [Candidatus Bathyarchaeota archaeon]|nr:hypothetical protein [Candidatus Bathyarchaeota archaeon]